jgi:hypothetical protein
MREIPGFHSADEVVRLPETAFAKATHCQVYPVSENCGKNSSPVYRTDHGDGAYAMSERYSVSTGLPIILGFIVMRIFPPGTTPSCQYPFGIPVSYHGSVNARGDWMRGIDYFCIKLRIFFASLKSIFAEYPCFSNK